MRLGILKNPVDLSLSKDEQLKALGMNSGNLVFWEAIQRLFQPINIPYNDKEKITTCDKIILTDLIWIRENSEYTYLENIIDNYKIPFIPISIGLQSNYYNPNFKFSDNLVRLLKKLEERAVLGVRGEYTADILNKYKIKNISVIGCPSMYFWNNRALYIEDNRSPIACSANFKTFYGQLNIAEKHFLSYCAQRDMKFVEQTGWKFSKENVNDENYYKFVNNWLSRRLTLPCNYKEWCELLNNVDFSLGGRFHGNVIALWNNIKSLFLTVDSRTKELTDFFRLPAIDLNTFDENKNINYYYEKADYSEFNKYYPSIYDNFLDFIKKNKMVLDTSAKPLSFNEKLQQTNKKNYPLNIHLTNYRKKNAIILTALEKRNGKITYTYQTEGAFSSYFINKRPFTVEYECSIENVPDSVAVLPFVALMLPLCWLSDATLKINEIDEDFYYCIDNIKRGYTQMYPQLEFKGEVVVDKIIKNRVDHSNRKTLCFFSGGVDATSTLLSNINYRPTLFTVWGTDIYFEQPKAWNIVKQKNINVAKQFDLNFTSVKTAFRYILDEKLLTTTIASKVNENWWHGFQHGIALLAHAAPYAYLNNITDINIASSYSVKDRNFRSCASYPTIDAMVEFCGCKIYHDGFEKSRTDKIRQIVEFSKRYNIKFSLRVCCQEITGENCCVCEKCQRTIFGIYAVGGNPIEFGFNLTPEREKNILESIRTRNIYYSEFWDDIKINLYQQKNKFINNNLVNELLKVDNTKRKN